MSDGLVVLVQAVSALANVTRTASVPPPEVLEKVTALVAQATAALDRYAWPGPYAVEQLAPPGNGRLQWDETDLRTTVPYSPILGHLNPVAGVSRIWSENEQVRGQVTLGALHAGPIGAAHGGVVAALLDEITSLSVLACGGIGYTQTLTVSYRRRTPLHEPLELWAQTAGITAGVYLTSAEIRHEGAVTASAVGVHRASGQRDQSVYCDNT
ncbi:PaaI family thioesterase [Mycobacterium sp. pW049]|uniref:PaaI family thioesterase n=1 Tax=[Mycobacterium] bulgaricum TaxID=3238985 RepID=UPI00351AE0E9